MKNILKWIFRSLLLLIAVLVLAAYTGYVLLIFGIVGVALALLVIKKARIPFLYGASIVLVLAVVTKSLIAPWVDQQLRTHAPLTYKTVKAWPILQDLLTAKNLYYPGLAQEVILHNVLTVADSVDAVQISKQADLFTKKLKDQGYLSNEDWQELERISNLIHSQQSKMKSFVSPDHSDGAKGDSAIVVTVPANQAWTFICQLKAGQHFRVQASGTWDCAGPGAAQEDMPCGPDGINAPDWISWQNMQRYPLPDGRLIHNLIARIGNNRMFAVNSSYEGEAAADGSLLVGPNDYMVSDNDGSMQVTVFVH